MTHVHADGSRCRAKDPSKCAFHGVRWDSDYELDKANRNVMKSLISGSFEDYHAARETQQQVKDEREAVVMTRNLKSSEIRALLPGIESAGLRKAVEQRLQAKQEQELDAAARQKAERWVEHALQVAREADGDYVKTFDERLPQITDARMRKHVQILLDQKQKAEALAKERNAEAKRRSDQQRSRQNSPDYKAPDMFDPANPIGFTNPLSPSNPIGILNPASPISPLNPMNF